ncbi:MAG: hypothetical protein ACXWN2_01500 [Candidatus Limnocylindrales bacterium]
MREALGSFDPAWIGLAVFFVALLIYVASNPARQNIYNHFVWQADAFLHGRFAIAWPVDSGAIQNGYFQDVFPLAGQPGYALLPFPPLPALILLPFVALGGLATDAALVAAGLGAVNVALAWRVTSRLTDDRLVALLATAFFGFGTVAWYAAMLGSTWFLAHVVASTFLLLAIAAALEGERRTAPADGRDPTRPGGALSRLVDLRQVIVAMVFGTAALARLTTIFGLPFFLLVGSGGTLRRRALSAALGAAVPLALLGLYNLVSSGHLFQPGYDYLYQTEYVPQPGGLLPQLFPGLSGITYHPGAWNAEDLRYLPQNLVIMLAWLPAVRPECGLGGLFSTTCPLVKPDALGMSLLLASPGYLLAIPALLRGWRERIVAGAALAVVAIALADLVHFSQGWVQFGYRFSNDFAPFLLVLVTLGLARVGLRWWSVGLIVLSIAINAWGVFWGVALHW